MFFPLLFLCIRDKGQENNNQKRHKAWYNQFVVPKSSWSFHPIFLSNL